MKPGEIVLSKPMRHHNASIDGYTIGVVAISMCDEPRLNAKRVMYRGNYFGCYIDRVIFSGPMTIVFWRDGSKTTVRLHQEKGKKKAIYDKYTAITWAMAKKYYGSRSQLEKRLRDICDDSKYDNMLVFTMLVTLFGDTKKLDEYVNDALKLAEDYNEQ